MQDISWRLQLNIKNDDKLFIKLKDNQYYYLSMRWVSNQNPDVKDYELHLKNKSWNQNSMIVDVSKIKVINQNEIQDLHKFEYVCNTKLQRDVFLGLIKSLKNNQLEIVGVENKKVFVINLVYSWLDDFKIKNFIHIILIYPYYWILNIENLSMKCKNYTEDCKLLQSFFIVKI